MGGDIMEDCIFCKIINGDIPSEKVYEDDKIYCFKDINPVTPVHVLIVPKKHIPSLNETMDEDKEILGYILFKAKDIAKILKIEDNGYRIVTNCGENAGQSVFHIHFHLLGGKTLLWP